MEKKNLFSISRGPIYCTLNPMFSSSFSVIVLDQIAPGESWVDIIKKYASLKLHVTFGNSHILPLTIFLSFPFPLSFLPSFLPSLCVVCMCEHLYIKRCKYLHMTVKAYRQHWISFFPSFHLIF